MWKILTLNSIVNVSRLLEKLENVKKKVVWKWKIFSVKASGDQAEIF